MTVVNRIILAVIFLFSINAILFCGNVYATGKDLVDMRSDPKLPKKFVMDFEKKLHRVLEYYKKHGMKRDKPIVVVLSQNPEYLIANINGEKSQSPVEERVVEFIRRTCRHGFPMGAWANPKAITFCINKNYDNYKKISFNIQFEVEAIMAHEIRHVFQYDLASYEYGDNSDFWFGPVWLVEGDANLHALQYEKEVHGRKIDIGQYSIYQAGPVIRKHKLRDYHFSSFSDSNIGAYSLGQLAVWMLREAYGKEKIDQYFRALKDGRAPNNTFIKVYGFSLFAVSDLLEELGGHSGKIRKWVNAPTTPRENYSQ